MKQELYELSWCELESMKRMWKIEMESNTHNERYHQIKNIINTAIDRKFKMAIPELSHPVPKTQTT